MKLKIKDLLAATPALKELSAAKLPAKTAYRIGKNLRLIQQELDHYDSARRKTIEDLGEPVADQPGSFQVKECNLSEFNDAMVALTDTEVDLALMVTTSDDLGTAELSASIFTSLHWMFEGGGDA